MKNEYSLMELIRNGISYIVTKCFYRKARLIRLPFYIRGKKKIMYGEKFTTGYGCRLEAFDIKGEETTKINIGYNCRIGDHVHIAAGEQVFIGDNCLLASKIYISDIAHGNYSDSAFASNPNTPPNERELTTSPVRIGKNVWIGDNVCVLPGVTIGDGCVIGANAVVNKDIPKNSIAVGVPAKVVKFFDVEKQIWKNK
ncbi:DapH/DapD/GlmU-related protein [Exiguobacterium sp. SL-9]|uniref:DapH/DapD/GlmU-related protein n=1 Tax=Exiguobacterium sp. SL-9 TaxID=2510963 RepID=UPI00103966F3|nr:DapH/DapD/GlmU-related protein [Exiguobacterium sp. SL-9]TCI21719.1 acetyltransferase [Exiguobacterium sp. SL-9]